MTTIKVKDNSNDGILIIRHTHRHNTTITRRHTMVQTRSQAAKQQQEQKKTISMMTTQSRIPPKKKRNNNNNVVDNKLSPTTSSSSTTPPPSIFSSFVNPSSSLVPPPPPVQQQQQSLPPPPSPPSLPHSLPPIYRGEHMEMLRTKNPFILATHKYRDARVHFEEKAHIYTIRGCEQTEFTSVTTWIHKLFPAFDADKIISKMMSGRKWNETNKYWGMTPDQIKQSWDTNRDEAARLGTNLHARIEEFMNGGPILHSSSFVDLEEGDSRLRTLAKVASDCYMAGGAEEENDKQKKENGDNDSDWVPVNGSEDDTTLSITSSMLQSDDSDEDDENSMTKEEKMDATILPPIPLYTNKDLYVHYMNLKAHEWWWNTNASTYESISTDESTQGQGQGDIEWDYFLRYIRQNPDETPYRTEWMVFHEELQLAGSIDMVYVHPSPPLPPNKRKKIESDDDSSRRTVVSLVDWKRAKEFMFDNKWSGGSHRSTAHIPDSNYGHYVLQLNIYKFILETKYNCEVRNMALVRFHPNTPTRSYEFVPVPALPQTVRRMILDRRAALELQNNIALQTDEEGYYKHQLALTQELSAEEKEKLIHEKNMKWPRF